MMNAVSPGVLAGQQGTGVGKDDRVVVHVHDPGVGGDRLGHLVGVGLVGMPVPMSRNCRIPAFSAR